MTTTPTLPFGTAIALAQRTLTATLHEVLESEHLSDHEWFTLNALGLRGPELPTVNLAALLSTNGLDRGEAEALVDQLAVQGLVERASGNIRITPDGQSRYETTRDRIVQSAAEIFGRFDSARVENARALLQEIAELDGDQITTHAE